MVRARETQRGRREGSLIGDDILKITRDEGIIGVRPEGGLKGEVQSRINIISKQRVKISLQIGAKMMKIE